MTCPWDGGVSRLSRDAVSERSGGRRHDPEVSARASTATHPAPLNARKVSEAMERSLQAAGK